MFRASNSGFFVENKKPDLNLEISRNIADLKAATSLDIVSKIQKFLDFYETYNLKSAFYSEEFKESWCNLISQHSKMLTSQELAMGEQVRLPQLHPIDQLLGIYYLALAIQEDRNLIEPDKPVSTYSKETLDLLHKAALSSIQAILLLRFYYFTKLRYTDAIDSFELENFKTMALNACKTFKSPGYLVYGELLMHLCNFFIKKKSTIVGGVFPDSSTNLIYDLFTEAVLNIYIADLQQKDSVNEINNAFMVSNGKIPYPQAFVDIYPKDATQYCRSMRKNLGLGVDVNALRTRAKMQIMDMFEPDSPNDKGLERIPMI